MGDALRVVGRALEAVWDHLFVSAMLSLFWWAALVLVLPMPPATLALSDAVRRMADREEVSIRDLLRRTLALAGVGWRWGALMATALLLLAVDLRVVAQAGPLWLRVAGLGFFWGAVLLWTLLQVLAVPLLFAQERPAVLQAQRNAAVMALQNPLYLLVLAVAAALCLWLSAATVIAALLWGPAFVAWVGHTAVEDRLRLWRATALPVQDSQRGTMTG